MGFRFSGLKVYIIRFCICFLGNHFLSWANDRIISRFVYVPTGDSLWGVKLGGKFYSATIKVFVKSWSIPRGDSQGKIFCYYFYCIFAMFPAGISCAEYYSAQGIPVRNFTPRIESLCGILLHALNPCVEFYSAHWIAVQNFTPRIKSLWGILFRAFNPCAEFYSVQGILTWRLLRARNLNEEFHSAQGMRRDSLQRTNSKFFQKFMWPWSSTNNSSKKLKLGPS